VTDRTEAPTEVSAEHEIHGVTPEMIDWWWVNMEKGYPLWCPEEHKSLEWEVPPKTGDHVAAIQIVEESVGGGPIMKIRLSLQDPSSCPVPVDYDHLALWAPLDPDNKPMAYVIHQYKATEYGTLLRSTFHSVMQLPEDFGERFLKHNKDEISNFPKFLPQLYQMWRAVKDPEINRQCSLRVKK
jgi:hypothetical protein